MSRALERAAAGACLIAPGSLAGCGEVDDVRPVLEDAHFEDPSTLLLRFSEPLASVDDLVGAAHFRLGSGFVIDGVDQTIYYDLSHHFADGLPGQGADVSGGWERHGLTLVSRVERGDDPTQLRLSLSYPLTYYVCDNLILADAMDIPAGIHLHYAEGGFPRVTDEAGNPLADIGAWWVGAGASATQPGAFPELDPRMPIPCPDL